MQEHNRRLLQAIRAGNIGIFEHDHVADALYWSPELRQMYGWDLDEPATLPKILAHVHPQDAERVFVAVTRAHDPNGDGSFDIEHRIVDRSGRLRWVLTRSQTYFDAVAGERVPSHTVGAVQDVTERRRAEERLHVLDTVVSSSAQAIGITDARGTLTFVNDALCRLWRYPDQSALLGRSLFEFWPPSDGVEAALVRLRQRGAIQAEHSATRVDGSSFYLSLTVEAVCDSKGELTQLLVTFSDITERKKLEAQVNHAQKLDSIGRLAGGIAHDFNNLLTVISGGIELGLMGLDSGHTGWAPLHDAADAARSAATLTRQLLVFSRKDMIAPCVVDVGETVARVEKMIARLIGEDILLECRCAPGLTPIWFDQAQVEQIILNLAVNARDAMPEGGRLRIDAAEVVIDAASAEERGDARPGRFVMLTVSDEGVGMSEDVRAHLFEPFFTTKEAGRGTGLGLAMVYGAVQQNGGWIEVDSQSGAGSTFRIYLPAAEGEARNHPYRVQAPATRTRTASILLVEDHSKVAAFAQTVLEKAGHRVHRFPNGEAALAALTTLQPPPELLISDMVMPGMGGRVLAERVTAQLPGTRVLLVSGYVEHMAGQTGALPRGLEFLPKPYSAEQLLQRVRELLA